jgi:hypothetical protein
MNPIGIRAAIDMLLTANRLQCCGLYRIEIEGQARQELTTGRLNYRNAAMTLVSSEGAARFRGFPVLCV